MNLLFLYRHYVPISFRLDGSLPKPADVILKVMQLQNRTPAEEFVYLVYIEEVPEELAKEMIEGRVKGTFSEKGK